MNDKLLEWARYFRLAPLLLGVALFALGCELDFTSEDEVVGQSAVSLAELNGAAPATPAETDNADTTTTEETDSTTTTEETTTPDPTPAAPASGVFRWEPGADSVRVVIPASLPHWKFWVFSRRKHATLYGPDQRSVNRPENVEYVLQGKGAYWRQQSLNAGDDGTLLIVINTKDLQANGERNAGWRIMRPEQAQSGDGDRLQPGGPDH